MKKKYLKLQTRIQPIEFEHDIMEMSLSVFDNNNPDTNEDSQITNGSEILINKHSIWEYEEKTNKE